jgi:hypothetical protein
MLKYIPDKVISPLKIGNWETTITRQGQTIATIEWKYLARSTLTMDGKTSTIKEAFPRSKNLST